MRRLIFIGLASAAIVGGCPESAAAGSLPSVTSGHRPGPDVLYAPPAAAPQLENGGVWTAPPILVSGASAYRSGEYLHQDFLYDDHGANSQVRDQSDPAWTSQLFARPNGTYTYPADPRYSGNAADVVELRVKPLADATAFRITLNTLIDPGLVGTTIAIGDSPVPVALPHGANATAPAELFLTVHGATADLRDAATGRPLSPAPTVDVDLRRRQVEVRVPASAWDPALRRVRLAAGVGLWAPGTDHYLLPQRDADASHPGGAGALPAPTAFFNVAFRHAEPMPNPAQLADETVAPSWWRDAQQGAALAAGNLAPFFDVVDFGRLRDGSDDDMTGLPQGVPRSGPMDRILASRFSDGQGVDYIAKCGTATCHGQLRGQLQPYAIYVPGGGVPSEGLPLTLLLHSLSSNYNQFLSNRNQSQFGERGRGSIVVTPAGRGQDGWYYDWAGADTFEVWADVARHYRLDPERTAITGYSMGGYGTWKFATQYPDLFAAGQPTVGPTVLGTEYTGAAAPEAGESTNTIHQLASLRNVPFLIWVAAADEVVPTAGTMPNAAALDRLGYRYEYDAFAPAEHLTLAIDDQYAPAAAWLGRRLIDPSPPHVSYAYNPTMDLPGDPRGAGHAYWLSNVRLRDTSGDPPIGIIDARSHAFGVGDPPASADVPTVGALPLGNLGVLGYAGQATRWRRAPRERRSRRLDVVATNVASVTVDVRRARIGCGAKLSVRSDGPLEVVLDGCSRTIRVRGAA
jgi:hypothetical protein